MTVYLIHFFVNPFTVPEITMAINSCNDNKSSRSDIPKVKFIKLSVNIISPIITEIFNKCLEDSIFPQSLKLAEITPVYKSGNKDDVNNHRPIAILSPFAKIFENHLYSCLTNFFNKNNVLYNKQFGFRSESSTELAIVDTVDEISQNMDNKLITCGIFLDLAKAFNTVNHDILLTKLEKYGVRGGPLNLIKSYLSSRMQVTKIGNFISDKLLIDTGVPQGSCLGPLFFLIYVNDMYLSTKFNIELYADDACLILAHKNPQTLENTVNKELENLDKWLKSNKLFPNYKKKLIILFLQKQNKIFHIISL